MAITVLAEIVCLVSGLPPGKTQLLVASSWDSTLGSTSRSSLLDERGVDVDQKADDVLCMLTMHMLSKIRE